MHPMFIACPSCPARFDSVSNLNRHIAKTGCNEGREVEISYSVEFTVRNMEVRISQKNCLNSRQEMAT